ncbi:MAG TPA: hypothetical protein VJ748_09210 [Vitreimonas sp.]|jgi:hypothetical protein|nr:hypothetical protein [Vitreimonas sp.]
MIKPLLAAIATASFLTLGACTQEARVEEETSTEQAAENLGNELEEAAENAGNELEQAGENAEAAVNDATDGEQNSNP